jgi:hypothetical protein
MSFKIRWEVEVRESRQLRSSLTGRDVSSHRGPREAGNNWEALAA